MAVHNAAQLDESPIGRLLLSMSAHTTSSLLLYSLYSIVNTIYIARGVGIQAAGAVSVSFPLSILLAAVSTTVGSGSASVISRALGERDVERASAAAANTFLVFWIVALLITVFGLIFLDPLLYLMGITESLLPYARDYLRIILLGAITSTAFSSIVRAEGNTRYSMYLWVIPTLITMILDPILIFGLRLGVKGAALAMVIGQASSVVMGAYYFCGPSVLRITARSFRPDLGLIGQVIAIGLPSFVQRASASVSLILVNNLLRAYGGDVAISAYGVVNRFTTFLVTPQQGLVHAMQPVVGYNAGAGHMDRVQRTIKLSSTAAGAYGLASLLIVQLVPAFWVGIFSTDADVLAVGPAIMRCLALTFPFLGVQTIHAAYFQSIGRVALSLVLSLCNHVLCLIPVLLVFSKWFGLTGIWLAFPVSALFSLGISSIAIIQDLNRPRQPVPAASRTAY